MGKGTSNAIIGFLAGAAAGTLIGILYAPDKGAKTRKKIIKQSQKLSSEVTGNVSEQVDNLKEYISDFVEDVKTKFSKLEKGVKDKISEKQQEAAEFVEGKASKVEEKARQAKKSA
jgi:gas vesicle protein